jgi:L-methionine (R)-S-oxide reductase
MRADYPDLAARLGALCAGETDQIALMASITCEVFHSDDRFDWVGFYRNMGDQTLKIGPYQGGHGCLTIPFSRGVCGAAARELKTQLVAEVDTFAGHIACASSTRSEIVLPVLNARSELLAVFDIDSDQPAAFDTQDQAALEAILADVFAEIQP